MATIKTLMECRLLGAAFSSTIVNFWSISDRQVRPQEFHFIPRSNDAFTFEGAKSEDGFAISVRDVTLSLNYDYRDR
jgi:hypothetical protein